MKQTLHFHRYEKMIWPNGKIFYKCMEPGCPHYLPVANLAIGRESLCWGPGPCNKLVVITKEDVQRGTKKPMCDECRGERQENREALKGI
jgi:hypothetical protein